MSRLTGLPHERCTLRSAHTALAEAVRRAVKPRPIWLAGLCYPTLGLLFIFGWQIVLGTEVQNSEPFAWLLAPLILFPIFRLIPGLARVCSPASWDRALEAGRRPGLRAVWRAGKGLTASSLALWFQVAVLELVVVLTAFGLFKWADNPRFEFFSILIGGPVLLFILIYVLVLSVLYQLALNSLAQNRRGMASALQHAWRIARNDPWATMRATIVDLEVWVVVLALTRLASLGTHPDPPAGIVLGFSCLLGFVGVARAGYWARSYRALGGLAPDDGVPGLSAELGS